MAWFTTDWSSSHHTVRCTHKAGDVINFITVACRISSRLKWYKNYKNRLRLAKVIVKNNMSRCYGSVCRSRCNLVTWLSRLHRLLLLTCVLGFQQLDLFLGWASTGCLTGRDGSLHARLQMASPCHRGAGQFVGWSGHPAALQARLAGAWAATTTAAASEHSGPSPVYTVSSAVECWGHPHR